jgi:MFS family permease
LLVAATLASGLGTWVAFVALTVDVWDRTHSSVWVSALLAADFLPLVAVGLLLAPLVDRLSRKRVMIGADLVRCGVFALLPFAGGPATIVVLAAIAGFASGFFRPALYAGVPNLVDDDDLPQANSLLQAVENVTWMLTPPLAGVLVGVWNPEPGYWINAASFPSPPPCWPGFPAGSCRRRRPSARATSATSSPASRSSCTRARC